MNEVIHTSEHETVMANEKMYCLQCDMPKMPEAVVTWNNHPTQGEIEYYVCSECNEEVDLTEGIPFCTNHGYIKQ